MNHSMMNQGLALFGRPAGPPDEWEELTVTPGATIDILLFLTYCPTILQVMTQYEPFTVPYTMPAPQLFWEPPLYVSGDLGSQGLIQADVPLLSDPDRDPARGTTVTHGVEVYGWYSQISVPGRGIADIGGPLDCTLWLLAHANGAAVRSFARTYSEDSGGQAIVHQCALIPEVAYTQQMLDDDNHLMGIGGGPSTFLAHIMGIYRVL